MALINTQIEDLAAAAARVGAHVTREQTPSLDEILVARAGGKGS